MSPLVLSNIMGFNSYLGDRYKYFQQISMKNKALAVMQYYFNPILKVQAFKIATTTKLSK